MLNSTKVSATRQLLAKLVRDYSPLAMYNALRVEDMVLMDMVCKDFPVIKIFTVDTGRLPAESHRLLQQIRRVYGDAMDVYYPNAYELQGLVKTQGTNGFFDGKGNRLQCCATRILHPIQRALSGKTAWLRGTYPGSQSSSDQLRLMSYDNQAGIPQLNPLYQWTQAEIWAYVKQNRVPYHALYDKKFTTIGCEPCTRASIAGESGKNSNWWWEQPDGNDRYPDLYIA